MYQQKIVPHRKAYYLCTILYAHLLANFGFRNPCYRQQKNYPKIDKKPSHFANDSKVERLPTTAKQTISLIHPTITTQ